MNVFEKVQKIKELILKANLKKSGKNTFAGYSYYELSDILPFIIKVCNELKLFTKVDFTEEFATLEIINIEEPSEKIEYKSPMKELNLKGANAIQALGGVETYQRRYLYMCAFDITENDMFDGTQLETLPSNANKTTISKMNKSIEEYAKLLNMEVSVVKAKFFQSVGITDENNVTDEQAKKIINGIKGKMKK